MDIVKSILNEIRGVPRGDEKRSLLEDILATRAGESRKEQLYASQVKIVEERRIVELQKRWDEIRKVELLEQERLDNIQKVRLQNLKKARRKLKRMRSQNE